MAATRERATREREAPPSAQRERAVDAGDARSGAPDSADAVKGSPAAAASTLEAAPQSAVDSASTSTAGPNDAFGAGLLSDREPPKRGGSRRRGARASAAGATAPAPRKRSSGRASRELTRDSAADASEKLPAEQGQDDDGASAPIDSEAGDDSRTPVRRRRAAVSSRGVGRAVAGRKRAASAARKTADEDLDDTDAGDRAARDTGSSEDPAASAPPTAAPDEVTAAEERGQDAESTSGPSQEAEFVDEPPGRERRRSSRGRRRASSRSRGGSRSPRGDAAPRPRPAPADERRDSPASVAAPESRSGRSGVEEVTLPTWVEPSHDPPATSAKGRDLMLAGRPIVDESVQEQGGRAKSLPKRILVNAVDPEEVRIAVIEAGRLNELYYDRPHEKKYLGNIYKGRIVNLEPAIQAAFVEIGIGRNGFLHVSDVLPAYKDASAIPIDGLSQRIADRRRLKIQDILREGQEVLVQISKDAIGAKGPSLTTYVSVPGKYLVLMPGVNRFGVSKKIHSDEVRHRLRKALSKLNPPSGLGYIVRTACYDGTQLEFEKDFDYLMKVWGDLTSKVQGSDAPCLVYAESDLVTRTMRDLVGADVGEVLIDDRAVHRSARAFCAEIDPETEKRVKHYSAASPIFTRFGVEEEIEKIYNRKVPLPSGGHIVVEQTEALVAIDVNSGKYRDEDDLEATALKTNLEAAEEIARQLRLRDLGGVIINDFIDMERESNRREVERAFRAALRSERAKCWISRISRFGIIEMTRQRVRPSFERAHYEPCECCRGTGVIISPRSTGTAILRQVRAGLALRRKRTCEVIAAAEIVDHLLNERRRYLVELESQFRKNIVVRADPTFVSDQYVIRYQ